MDLADLRRDYKLTALDDAHADADPLRQFERWFDETMRAGVEEPNAMALATATKDGVPSVRIVLLKAVDARGFAFYTDYRSRKGRELAHNPRAELCFFWKELERQVRVRGSVERVSQAETTAYFESRPIESRIGAWASHQSSVLTSRTELETRVTEARARFPEHVPTPPHWGGFRVVPTEIEFWQGRPNRLHDRLLYTRAGMTWQRGRLSP